MHQEVKNFLEEKSLQELYRLAEINQVLVPADGRRGAIISTIIATLSHRGKTLQQEEISLD